MLYITTRGKNDVYTPARTLQLDRGSDGGMFVPFRMPVMETGEICDLVHNKPSQNIANYLNMVYGTKLTDWDIELSLASNGLQLNSLGRRLSVWELWHTKDGKFTSTIESIARQVKPDGVAFSISTEWLRLSIRIAMVIGLFTKLLQDHVVSVDAPVNFAVCSGDFSMVMALWYAREMGLPVRDIVIGCNENGAPWDLIVRGQVDFGNKVVHTGTPDSDFAVPPAMERLIHGACGLDEVMNFCWSMTDGGVYTPEEDVWNVLRKGLYASVVSQGRIEIMIPSVFRSMKYVMDPYGALAYGALSDYRAKTGDATHTIVVAEYSPLCSEQFVSKAMRISGDELRHLLR